LSRIIFSDKLNFDIEKEYWQKGFLVAGIDEVGRGCLAGPVVAASVIFKSYQDPVPGIKDSKKLNSLQRETLYKIISDTALEFSYYFIDNEVIDKINILNATMLAMENSVFNLKNQPEYLLIDGNFFLNKSYNYKTIVKGDSISPSIAASSIIAKVIRDEWMINVADKEFPQYDFKNNKGYGTKRHIQAIKEYGICKYHRLTFLKKISSLQNSLFSV